MWKSPPRPMFSLYQSDRIVYDMYGKVGVLIISQYNVKMMITYGFYQFCNDKIVRNHTYSRIIGQGKDYSFYMNYNIRLISLVSEHV